MFEGQSLKSLLLEVASIVLGVLLALAVNEWQQDRERAELAFNALSNIASELAANSAILESIHNNNVSTIAAANAATGSSAEDEDLEQRPFIPGVQVRATAWEALLSSGAANYIDYDLLLELSETYSMQSVYRSTGMQLVESSMAIAAMSTVNNTTIDNQHFQQQFENFFAMMLQMEEVLLADYASTQSRLSQALDEMGAP